MVTRKKGKIIVPTEPVSRATTITGFTFKSYDKQAGVFQFEIKNQDGSPTDLIGATVRLFMYIYSGEEKKEFPVFDNQIITESYMQGVVKYPIPDMLLAYEGKVDANVYIDFPDGSHTDNLGFTFNIEKSVIDGEVQANGDYYFKDFQQLLEGVQQEADEAVAKALEGLDQTISDAKADVDGFVQEATSTVNQTVDALNEELQTTQGQVAEVAQATDTIQTDLATIQEELTNAEEYFVKKETLEVGPLVFKNTQITTQDWNDIQDVGIYYCAGSSGENMPTSGPLYGYLTVKKITSVTQQTYETGISLYIRSLTGNPQTWSNWHEVAMMENTVNVSGDQEIKGTKNFTGALQSSGKKVAEFDEVVNLTEEQTVKGLKDFTGGVKSKGKSVLTTDDMRTAVYTLTMSDVPDSNVTELTGELVRVNNEVTLRCRVNTSAGARIVFRVQEGFRENNGDIWEIPLNVISQSDHKNQVAYYAISENQKREVRISTSVAGNHFISGHWRTEDEFPKDQT